MVTMASATSSAISLPQSSSKNDLYLTPAIVGSVCEESSDRMQLVAELLLLQSGLQPSALEPVSKANESYGKSRDAIVANTKGLAISIKDLSKHVHQMNLTLVYQCVQQVADQVIILVEAATHAAYFTALTDVHCTPATPGVVDRYSFARAKQAVNMAYSKFKPESGPLTRDQTIQISRTFANNLALLTQGCKLAAENKKISEMDQMQFANCAQCLQGTTAAFLSSLKAFAASHSAEKRKRCLLFGKPVIEAVNCVVEFANLPEFKGKPAKLTERGYESQTDILGGAMAIVSSSVQLMNTTKSLLEHGAKEGTSHWQKFVNCSKAVADATKLLSSSIREHTPAPSRRPSLDQYQVN